MMTQEILLEVFKKVSLYDLSDSTFEYGNEDGEIYINALKGTGSVFDAIKYDGNLFWMMNNDGSFNLLNPMLEAFQIYIPMLEHLEYTIASTEAMYCVECQALEEHDCFCEEMEDSTDCHYCCGSNGNHFVECPYNNNPFHNLLRDGYD